jgi:hypothetical protein
VEIESEIESLASRTWSAALQLRFAQNGKPPVHELPAFAQTFTGVCCDLVLSSRMSRRALAIALGLFGACLPLAAQQAKHSGATKHRVAASAVMPLDAVSNLSIYRPNVMNGSNSILFHNGPVRAWSDGAQLVSESAFVQIGMAPLGLFPVTYLAPSDVGTTPVRKPNPALNYKTANLATDGKDLPAEMLSSPLNQVYVTGEVGFMYGQWSGKGSGDYVGSYIWGQAANDKFQITAGASFENWNGNSPKIRAYPFSR